MKTLPFSPVGPTPSARQLEWYGRGATAFFHFGINTFTDMEWGDGTEDPALFNPTELDCRQWIRTIKAAGFTAAILTAKHHDGFCLWPSAYTEHSVKNSPYKNGKGDIVREFTDACREEGIKAGLYLSPWDRHEPTWGTPEYDAFYVGQLTELFSNYGEIYECWWDGAGSDKAHYDWQKWADLVHTLQPNALIFAPLPMTDTAEARWVGNEVGYAGLPCYATITPEKLTGPYSEYRTFLMNGERDGTRYIPAEADVSIRPGWFYHASQDGMVRSPKNLTDLWFHSAGRGAGLLMNFPPDKRGLLHETDVASLTEFGKALAEDLAKNLASGATVSASSVRHDGFAPEGILTSEGYAPCDGDVLPTVTLTFPAPVTFNTFTVREALPLGHRVFGFSVEARIAGEWRPLLGGEVIGALCARRFPTVTADALRLTVTDAVAEPVLHGLGLYLFRAMSEKENAFRQNLADWSATYTAEGDAATIRLCGIFPYSLLRHTDCKGVRRIAIDVFDGTEFVPYTEVEHDGSEVFEYRFPEVIDYSYQLRIRFLDYEGRTLGERKRPMLY